MGTGNFKLEEHQTQETKLNYISWGEIIYWIHLQLFPVNTVSDKELAPS